MAKRDKKLDQVKGDWKEAEKFNERPVEYKVEAPPQGKSCAEVILDEITIPDNSGMGVNLLFLEDYLTPKAKELHNGLVPSTVLEYWEMEDGSLIPDFTPINRRHPDDQKELPEGIKARKTTLVRFLCGRVTVEHYHDRPTDEQTQNWASLLNSLAERDIWKFGTLMKSMWMTLELDKHGKPYFDPHRHYHAMVVDACMPDTDPRKSEVEEWPEQKVENRGRTLIFLTYLALDPKYDKYETAEELNKHLRLEVFVEEGRLGSENWRLKQ